MRCEILVLLVVHTLGFAPPKCKHPRHSNCRVFGSAQKRQEDLAKKMELARKTMADRSDGKKIKTKNDSMKKSDGGQGRDADQRRADLVKKIELAKKANAAPSYDEEREMKFESLTDSNYRVVGSANERQAELATKMEPAKRRSADDDEKMELENDSVLFSMFSNGRVFGKAGRKQAELARKLELAKKSKIVSSEDKGIETENDSLDSERAEFAQLLFKSRYQPPKPDTSSEFVVKIDTFVSGGDQSTDALVSGPKVRAKDLKRRKKAVANSIEDVTEESPSLIDERIAVGQKGHRIDFEALIVNSKPLGPILAAQLVPWVPPYLTSCLVVLADPRRQSDDLRLSIQYLQPLITERQTSSGGCPLAVITSDTCREIEAWRKRVGTSSISESTRIFSDPSLEWMKKYCCVDYDDRWSLHALLFDSNGIIRHNVRIVDPSRVYESVSDMIASVDKR